MDNLTAVTERDRPAPNEAPPELLFDLPGHAERALAFLIDVVLVWVGMYVVATIMAVLVPDETAKDWLTRLVQVGGLAYFVVGWARGGQTIGMLPFHQRVVRADDLGALGWFTALVRLVGLIVAIVSIVGILWVLVDPRRRGLHDRIAGTQVISG